MKNYVIIGNGIAAAGCIEGIRSIDKDGLITVISEEKHPVYCRPLISYYLEDRTDLERINYRDPGYYDRMGCKVLYGCKAVGIDPQAHKIKVDDGSSLPYDALCTATGSVPFLPHFEGLDSVLKKFSFMTLDDALALEKAIKKSSRVLIIGAGMIGLKCAEGICGRVKSVTVCDLADHLLPSVLDFGCAALLQKRMEEHGIRFIMGDSVSLFNGKTAHMKSGSEIDFDVLVLAVGVRPNTSLIKEAGGKVGRGIITDTRMQTSLPDVFAAGDCVESLDAATGENRVLANLPNASMQGFAAGVNMAGGSAVCDKGILMNSIGFFGLHAMTAGSYEGEVYEEKTEGSVKRLYTKDDRLKGFILVGSCERTGIYTSMIREKTPLSSVDFELLKKLATTAAFSKDARRKKFGGAV